MTEMPDYKTTKYTFCIIYRIVLIWDFVLTILYYIFAKKYRKNYFFFTKYQ